MLKIIGIFFVTLVMYAIIKMILYRVFPEWGLKEAKSAYNRNPDKVNERLLWEARSRVNKANSKK